MTKTLMRIELGGQEVWVERWITGCPWNGFSECKHNGCPLWSISWVTDYRGSKTTTAVPTPRAIERCKGSITTSTNREFLQL